jgi:zinc resistance-associated protein
MLRYVLPLVTALAIYPFGMIAEAVADEPSVPAGMEKMQQWASDREAVSEAQLAGLKAGLKLNPDQQKLWQPFEAAVLDAMKMRTERMPAMMDRMQKMREMNTTEQKQDSDEPKDMGSSEATISPIDNLETMADAMIARGGALKKIADPAKFLYASLDESQKRLFALLGPEALTMGIGHRGMGMMGDGGKGMMGDGGKEMMRARHHAMEKMGDEQCDDERDSDE